MRNVNGIEIYSWKSNRKDSNSTLHSYTTNSNGGSYVNSNGGSTYVGENMPTNVSSYVCHPENDYNLGLMSRVRETPLREYVEVVRREPPPIR